jgi:hypothetical protein
MEIAEIDPGMVVCTTASIEVCHCQELGAIGVDMAGGSALEAAHTVAA